jgi:hypothetical protein
LADIGFEIDDDRYYLSEKSPARFRHCALPERGEVILVSMHRGLGAVSQSAHQRLWEHWLRPFYDNYDSDGEGPLVFLKAKKP